MDGDEAIAIDHSGLGRCASALWPPLGWRDDILDAGAAAWTAHRIARMRARSLPDPPERDTDGRPVATCYAWSRSSAL
ncbi:DUF429 domain-containing protein [Streptomyces sp. NPDC054765]